MFGTSRRENAMKPPGQRSRELLRTTRMENITKYRRKSERERDENQTTDQKGRRSFLEEELNWNMILSCTNLYNHYEM